MKKWFALMALAVILTPGCAKPAPPPEIGGPSPIQMKPETSDEKIQKSVQAKFASDPELKKEAITIEVKDGRVTLSGTVSDDGVRGKADLLAREVSDVFGVDAEKLVTK